MQMGKVLTHLFYSILPKIVLNIPDALIKKLCNPVAFPYFYKNILENAAKLGILKRISRRKDFPFISQLLEKTEACM